MIIGETPRLIIKKILILFSLVFLINLISIIFVEFSINSKIYDYRLFFTAQKTYESPMIENFGGLNYGSSIYMPIRYFLQYPIFKNSIFSTISQINPYFVCFLISLPFTILILLKNKINLDFNKFLELTTIYITLFTPITGDYYLLLLLIPLLIIKNDYFSRIKQFLYIAILLPKIFIYHGKTISTFVNPLLLLILLVVILFEKKNNSIIAK